MGAASGLARRRVHLGPSRRAAQIAVRSVSPCVLPPLLRGRLTQTRVAERAAGIRSRRILRNPLSVPVLVLTRQGLDAIRLHATGAAVLLRTAARADVGAEVLQRFGMADSREGIAERCVDELAQSLGCAALGFEPIAQVFGWARVRKASLRFRSPFKTERLPEGTNRHRSQVLRPRLGQCGEQATGVLGRSQQAGSFQQASQLVSGDQGERISDV